MRSDTIKRGIERAPHRALLRSLGLSSKELEQPFVGIVNSFSEIIPGHKHLQTIAQAVREGVYSGGGTPFEVNTIAVCDGIAMNHPGMRYSLPSRELIADSVEILAQAHDFDALVFVASCDKIIPGMLLAAVRVNIPSIFISGGPMLAGRVAKQNPADLSTMFMAVGRRVKGEISQKELEELEQVACPGYGSCAGMFTAMNIVLRSAGFCFATRQIERYKGKLYGRKRQPSPLREELAMGQEEPRKVVKIKQFAVKPISVDEAIDQMELLRHDFFVFFNQDSAQINVLYRRKDGNYGLIEPQLG